MEGQYTWGEYMNRQRRATTTTKAFKLRKTRRRLEIRSRMYSIIGSLDSRTGAHPRALHTCRYIQVHSHTRQRPRKYYI